jgi:hypothetical protein
LKAQSLALRAPLSIFLLALRVAPVAASATCGMQPDMAASHTSPATSYVISLGQPEGFIPAYLMAFQSRLL